MYIKRKYLFLSLTIIFISLIFMSCSKSLSDSNDAAKNYSETYNRINSVNENFVPDTLKAQNSFSVDSLKLLSGDPFESFVQSQPRFLKSYLETARVFIEELLFILEEADEIIVSAENNSNGNVDIEDEGRIYWEKTAEDKWEILLKSEDLSKSLLYLKANVDSYTLKIDGTLMNENDVNSSGMFESEISYVSDSEWENEITITDVKYNASQPDNPERMKIIIKRKDDIWIGKVMSYHPYANNPPNSPSMNVYTDFIADEAVSKMSIYFLGDSVSDLSNISNYALGRVRENYPSFTQSSLANTYPNPAVIRANIENAVWGDNGTQYLQSIVGEEYLDANLWIVPTAFKVMQSVVLVNQL
jgi:hypothetical protein